MRIPIIRKKEDLIKFKEIYCQFPVNEKIDKAVEVALVKLLKNEIDIDDDWDEQAGVKRISKTFEGFEIIKEQIKQKIKEYSKILSNEQMYNYALYKPLLFDVTDRIYKVVFNKYIGTDKESFVEPFQYELNIVIHTLYLMSLNEFYKDITIQN